MNEDEHMLTQFTYLSNDEDGESKRSRLDLYLTENYGDPYDAMNQMIVRPKEPSDPNRDTILHSDPDLLWPSISNASDAGSSPTENLISSLSRQQDIRSGSEPIPFKNADK